MTTIDWKSIVKTVAPGIATAFGGPLAGMAVSALAAKLLPGKADATEEDVSAAILAASPADLAKIRLAEIDFQKAMADNGIKLEEIAAGDRDSARKREMSVKDWVPGGLGIVITAGFFAALGYMLVNGKPPSGGDALLVMLGALGGAFGSIVAYYYGSSAGSASKTDTIANLVKK